MKLIVVGQAPGPRSGSRAFDGLSGDRLARYMGLQDRSDLLARVECVNVLRAYPGPEGDKGDAFPLDEARRASARLYRRLKGRRVLVAGKRVAAAFGMRAEYLEWVDHEAGFEAVVIPHPSGVNRWWNEPKNRRRFRRFARDLVG